MHTVSFSRLALLIWLFARCSSVRADDGDDVSAFNNVTLNAPPIPTPPPPTQFDLHLESDAQNVAGLSIQQAGSFLGFSIEMSVVNQIVGGDPGILQVPFLNLMSIVAERAGQVNIRVGGNSQDTASWVESLPDGDIIAKDTASSTNPTDTPALSFTTDFLYLFSNVSSFVNAKWYLGLPMNDTAKPRLEIAELGEDILGDHLLGFQLGNEPDFYSSHGHRPANYDPSAYATEFGAMISAINDDDKITTRGNLVAPSITGTQKGWSPEAVWNTGFVDTYSSSIGALAVERYPDNNCANNFQDAGLGPGKSSQEVFPNYLNHTSGVDIVSTYLNSTAFAQQKNKPFIMMETNSASCGGFPGVSDSFGAALWALDYALQMAYVNFTGAHLHVGGMNVAYNPFTPPMTNQSTFRQWTVGPVFYSVVAAAETFGRSGKAQIVDLQANGGNIYTPAYAVYDGGNLDKVALFNYVTDPTGASKYTATISVPSGTKQVSVKYLSSSSVADKFNITWAGQTLGDQYNSDGRFQNDEVIDTVQCDQTANTCAVDVPAPAFALVFLNSDALATSEPSSTATFATTTFTGKGHQSASAPTFSAGSPTGSSSSDSQATPATGSNAKTGDAFRFVPGLHTVAALLAGMTLMQLF